MEYQENQPNFAIRVMIFREGKVLLGKHIGTQGNEKYGFAGGHLQYKESFAACAKREILEECGIEIDNLRYPTVSNIIENERFHNVHITLLADYKSGELTIKEPEKYTSWDWYDVDNLPAPLFKNCELSIKNYKDGTNYFDLEDSK